MASWQNSFYTPVECLSERSPECDVTRHLVSVNNGCYAAFIMTSLYRFPSQHPPLGLTSRVPAHIPHCLNLSMCVSHSLTSLTVCVSVSVPVCLSLPQMSAQILGCITHNSQFLMFHHHVFLATPSRTRSRYQQHTMLYIEVHIKSEAVLLPKRERDSSPAESSPTAHRGTRAAAVPPRPRRCSPIS